MRLRPSMRENYRYILARISSSPALHDSKDIYLAASESFSALFGDFESARAWIAVLESSDQYAIFRYRRGMDTRVEAALAAVCFIGGRPAAIHPIRISGTIRTLREKISRTPIGPARSGVVKKGETMHTADIFPCGRIDLKEKTINLQIPLYITEEDIEDLYYDE